MRVAMRALEVWVAGCGVAAAAALTHVSSETELMRRLDSFARRAPPAAIETRPAWLESSADRYGEFVARARKLDAGADWFDRAVAVGGQLSATDENTRSALEERTGDREPELEILYSSQAWQRLDYAQVMLDYWRAWASLSLALNSSGGASRDEALHDAERGFARSALELRLPRVAAASLLGLGIARRELGEFANAQRTLARLEQRLEAAPDDALAGAAGVELAGIAFARGDVEAGARHAARIPAGSVRAEQRTQLALEELEARLRDSGPPGDSRSASLDAAAALVRDLTSRGGETAQRAAQLAATHADTLGGRDIGPLGALLEAESAYDAGDFQRARDSYRVVLDDPAAAPGLVVETARYKWARSVAHSGDPGAAMRELERLVAGGGGGPVRVEAVQLWFALAERSARQSADSDAERNALRAARRLVEIAPTSPAASGARLRIARSSDRARERSSALEAIPESSPQFTAARVERVRLRADAFVRRGGNASTARQLGDDLDRVAGWVSTGRLDAAPARDAAFAVVRAKASLRAGDPLDQVLERVARAEARPGIDASHRRVLLRVRLQALVRARRTDALDAGFQKASDADVTRDWRIWTEAVIAAAPNAPPSRRVNWYARLEGLAPEAVPAALRRDVSLGYTRSLIAAGRGPDALIRARDHATADPDSGDARVLLALALEAVGSSEDALLAWREVSAGVEPGSERWFNARFSAIAAARKAGSDAEVCREVAAIRALDSKLDAGARADLAAAGAGCPQ